MTQALTFYCPYVSAAYRKGRGVYTKVLEWRSLNTGRREYEMPDCGRDELIKRHRGLVGWPYVPRLKISHRLFAAR